MASTIYIDNPRRPLPMSPHPINSPITATKQTKTVTPPSTRPCSQCRAFVPTTLQFKTCDTCREKARQNNAKTAIKRKREKEAMMSKLRADGADGHAEVTKSSEMDKTESETEEGGINGEGWDRMKKRIRMEFADAKAKGKVPVKNSESKKRPSSSYEPTEYQSPTLLFSALSSQSKGKALIFSASYSIISTASPPVSVTRRLELVSRTLRKELKDAGRGRFDRHNPTSQSTTALTSSQTFACLCSHIKTTKNANNIANASGSSSSPPDASNPKPNLRHTQSDLSRYFGGISAVKEASTSTSAPVGDTGNSKAVGGRGTGCGGKIKITVEDDFSHPVGIKGHRVLIEVEH